VRRCEPKAATSAAHYAQIKARRGAPQALGAIRRDILIAFFHIVRDGTVYRDLGADWHERRNATEHRPRRLVKQLEALGHTVTLDPAA
jgi:transposase